MILTIITCLKETNINTTYSIAVCDDTCVAFLMVLIQNSVAFLFYIQKVPIYKTQ